jgi:hypothetical protein
MTSKASPQLFEKHHIVGLRLPSGYFVLPRSAGRDILKAQQLDSFVMNSGLQDV